MSIIVVCEIDFRVSDKMGILSWCTAACVTFFCFAQAATETLGLAELLRLINRDVLKRG